jgi:hypothetical protein
MELPVTRIGWFTSDCPRHPEGIKAPVDVYEKLKQMGLKYRVKCCMGHHICEMCFPSERDYYDLSVAEKKAYPNFHHWGNGELWIKGKYQVWVAPTLIVHYIRDHGFCPSKDFMDDVMALSEEDMALFYNEEKLELEEAKKRTDMEIAEMRMKKEAENLKEEKEALLKRLKEIEEIEGKNEQTTD